MKQKKQILKRLCFSRSNLIFFIIMISVICYVGCDGDDDEEKNLSYSKIQKTQCEPTDYVDLESRLYFTENEVAGVFGTDHYCFSELAASTDFENSSLIYLTEGVEAGCGESGIEIDYLRYNAGAGILYAYFYKWNYQVCQSVSVIGEWLIIDKIPKDTKLEVIVKDAAYGGEGKQLSYSEIQKTQCKDYPELKSGLFFTEDEVAEVFGTDHYCFSELATPTDFENSTLIYLGGIMKGCGEPTDIEIKYMTYDAGAGRLYAHLLRRNYQFCLTSLAFDKWYIIDKIPKGTKLRISVEDETNDNRQPF